MQTLNIDIETYCETDIRSAGAYKYAENAEIILFGYSVDGGPVEVIDLGFGEIDIDQYGFSRADLLPPEIYHALTDPSVVKKAFNAAFEMAVIGKYYGIELDPLQWECTMVKCAIAGLPMQLGLAAKALELEQEKDTLGKRLIKLFCEPQKPTAKIKGGRRYPDHDPVKWRQFIEYCRKDVEVEMAIGDKLIWVQFPERNMWALDQKINRLGVRVDLDLARKAVEMDRNFRAELTEEAVEITGLDNPNSVAQLKDWIGEEEGIVVNSMTKASVAELLNVVESEKASRVLSIRAEMARSSVKKYLAMLNATGEEDRARGLLQYCGAGRTWRWAGRLIQVQNLPRISMKSSLLDNCRTLLKENDHETLKQVGLAEILPQLIRTAFVPAPGYKFVVSDFSAIEARVSAWVAGEKWRLKTFAEGKIDIYCASAAQMFKIDPDTILKKVDGKKIEGPNYAYRQKGKVTELACGYQGSTGALIQMGALEEGSGIQEKDLQGLVDAWRAASPSIVQTWWELDRAAKTCIRTRGTVPVNCAVKGIMFSWKRNCLLLHLPSGRALYYWNAGVEQKGDRKQAFYWGLNQTVKKWEKISSYGGKWFENLVQAIARDCLAQALLHLDAAGWKLPMHVHDEAVAEEPIGGRTLDDMNKLMIKGAPWMQGLLLTADGFEGEYYKK